MYDIPFPTHQTTISVARILTHTHNPRVKYMLLNICSEFRNSHLFEHKPAFDVQTRSHSAKLCRFKEFIIYH